MKKQLSEIDPVYANIICKLSKQSRLWYCEKTTYKVASEIIKNKKNFKNELIEKWLEVLTAAQNEAKKINKEK